MYSSDNNNLHDDKIQADQIFDLIESLGDDKLTAFFKQMDYPEEEKILYLYQQLMILPKYDKDGKLLPVSETDQLAAVNKDGIVIFYIKNPSEEIQLAAVNNYGLAIRYIIEQGIIPSEEVQLAAVNENGFNIREIMEKGIIPSEDVQLAAVNENGTAIEYIKNPSEDVQLAAVNENGDALHYIKNPSEKVKQIARDKGMKNV